MKMKKLLMIFVFLLTVSSVGAVKYRSVGGNADFSAYVFDGEYFLVLSFSDGADSHLMEETMVIFKLKDGRTIRLKGVEGSVSLSSNSHYNDFGQASTDTKKNGYTKLKITKEQIAMLNTGVEIVAINTIPEAYVRNKWTGKEKFGQRLYEDFQSLKDGFGAMDLSGE